MQRREARIASVVAAALMAAGAAATPETRLTVSPSSTLTLRGKSTLHDYESKATRLDLRVEVAEAVPAGPTALARLGSPGAVKSFVLVIPVQGLRSPKEGIDKNMHKALRSAQHPDITFRLSLPAVTAVTGETATVAARGDLQVAGQTRPIDLEVRATSTREGIVLEGTKSLLMSEFGIKPPTMMLGTLKTADRIDISFRLLVGVDGL